MNCVLRDKELGAPGDMYRVEDDDLDVGIMRNLVNECVEAVKEINTLNIQWWAGESRAPV